MNFTPEQALAIERTKLLREIQRTRHLSTGTPSPLSPAVTTLDDQIAALVGWDTHKHLLVWAESFN